MAIAYDYNDRIQKMDSWPVDMSLLSPDTHWVQHFGEAVAKFGLNNFEYQILDFGFLIYLLKD